MLHNRIKGTTRTLGKSQGYLALNIRDELEGEYPYMVSSWTPTPKEMEILNMGGSIHLKILGTGHPPVKFEVVEAETDAS